MTAERNEATRASLERLLAENGLSQDTWLYREALRQALEPTETPGVFRLTANTAPNESVVDVYGQAHVVQAEHVGPGLAFAESSRPDWQETMQHRAFRVTRGPDGGPPVDRVEVAVQVQDVLRQGGLLYPVESVVVERAWYCTLPSGSVNVRVVA